MRTLWIGGFFLWAAWSDGTLAADQIAVDAADAPFMYESGGRAAGLYPSLIAEAYRRMGMEVGIVALPWRRALDGADNGLNGVAGLYKTEERLKKYDYSAKLFDEIVEIYVRKGQRFPFARIEDLKGHSVGVIRGWSYGDDFDAARRRGLFPTEESAGDEQNFTILDAGHIDCILAIREAAAAATASHGWQDRFEALAVPLSKNPSYVAFNKSAGKLSDLQRLNAAIAAMRADGSFTRLIQTTLAPVQVLP